MLSYHYSGQFYIADVITGKKKVPSAAVTKQALYNFTVLLSTLHQGKPIDKVHYSEKGERSNMLCKTS